MKELKLQTSKAKQVVDFTDQVEQALVDEGVRDGVCFLSALHTTVGLTTADLDPGTDLDMLDAFEELIPKLNYRHPHDPSHVPDHILSSLIGTSLTLPVRDGKLVLGTWQRVVLFEFYGPKERKINFSFLENK